MLTKVDLTFSIREEAGSFIRSFNPATKPGIAYLIGATPLRTKLGSQVAARLAIDKFLESLSNSSDIDDRLEKAFAFANSAIYEFGHKLAAGGRMSTTLVAVCIENGEAHCARVAGGDVLLYRRGQIFSFFDDAPIETEAGLGGASLVSVQLSNIELNEFDKIIFLSNSLPQQRKPRLLDYLEVDRGDSKGLLREVFPFPDEQDFVGIVNIGPNVIFLNETNLL